MARDMAAVRRAVLAEMGARRWSRQKLAEEADVDAGTIGDFLDGNRSPRVATLGAVEAAFGWKPGYLQEVADGIVPAETVAAGAEDEPLLHALTPQQRDQINRLPKDQRRAALAAMRGAVISIADAFTEQPHGE